MTVIRPNSISGITSLTAHRGSIDFYAHDGSAATFNNINSNVTSGVSTFASLNITGDLDVGGALTYEDVTNIDSVGVITARNGIHVTGGQVGVNTTSPAEKLDVWGTIRASEGTSQYMHMYPVAGAGYFDVSNSTTYPSILFRQIGSGGTQERLRINSSGYVGINDNNPDTQLSVNSGATNVVAKFASTDQYAWIQFRDNSTTDTAVMVGADGDNLLLRSGSNERVRVTSGGTVKFATNNSSTDYLEWGGNPRLMLQAPAGLNGLRVYGTTTPFEVGGSASTRKISMGGDPNYDLSISADYSLSSGGHDSSPKVFLNATRHNGSGTVTSFQTSIQAVSVSNTAGDGYLGLGASATPDDLVIRPSGNIGIGEDSPDRLLHIKGSSSTAYSGGSDTADYNFLKIENTTNDKSAGIFFQIGGNGEAAITATEVADGATDIAFQNRGGGVRSEKLRITSAGDMGLGTATPTSFGPTFQISGADPALLLQDTATSVDYYGMNIGNGHVTSWFDDSAYFAIGTAAGLSGASYAEKLRIRSGGEIASANLSINGFAHQNTPSGYSQFQSDNHANTIFGQNLKLGASAGSGNHQIEIINQHPTVGGAGMYIGGNTSNQENAINFYAEAANQSAGTNVTANRRFQIGSSAFFSWVEPRNQNSNAQSYIRTFGFTFNLQDGETETLFYNPDGYRRIYYEMYVQSGHGSNGYGYILGNISRYGSQIHDADWHVSYTTYSHSGSVNGNVNHNGIKFTRSGYSNTNITYYVIVKCWSPAGGNPYGNSGLTDPSYRYYSQGY